MPEFNKESMNRAVVSEDLAAQVTGGDVIEDMKMAGKCFICGGDHSPLECPNRTPSANDGYTPTAGGNKIEDISSAGMKEVITMHYNQ